MARTKTSKEEKVINYIPLTDNYYYSADDNNYILYYFNRRNKTDIKTKMQTDEILETYDIVGFYTTLENLIKATVTHLNRTSIIEGQIKTLKDCIQQIITTTERLREMLE